MIRESFANTAFIGEQPKRILATKDHDPTRLIGRVENLEPFHKEGLIATIRAADTPLGRESVELARDEILDASIGFQIPDAAAKYGRAAPVAASPARYSAKSHWCPTPPTPPPCSTYATAESSA